MDKEKLLIENVFDQKTFKKLHQFAKKKHLIYLKDLSMEMLEEFSQEKGVGSEMMFAVIEKIAGPIDFIQESLF